MNKVKIIDGTFYALGLAFCLAMGVLSASYLGSYGLLCIIPAAILGFIIMLIPDIVRLFR